MSSVSRLGFDILAAVGHRIGGVRPRRILYSLARDGFATPRWSWYRRAWGEFRLSPHSHIDRIIIGCGQYEPPTHRFIERYVRPGMTCFDIGANIGEIAVHLGKRAGGTGDPAGRVFAFEPVPAIAARLEEHVDRNGLAGVVQVHRVALCDRIGEVTFHIADELAENQGQGSLVADTAAGGAPITVRTSTLDRFCADHDVEDIALIKADIQGAEPLLFRGGPKVLGEWRPAVLCEFSPEDLRGTGMSSRDQAQALTRYGYRLHRLADDGTPGEEIDVAGMPDDFEAEGVVAVHPDRPLGA